MFPCFLFLWQGPGIYLSLSSPSLSFTLGSVGTAKFSLRQVLSVFFFFLFFFFFFLLSLRSGLLAEIRWYICISKSQRIWYVWFSRTDSELCIYNLFAWSNSNFLHNSQCIILPTQLCIDLYSLCASYVIDRFVFALIMWVIVLSQLLHSLQGQSMSGQAVLLFFYLTTFWGYSIFTPCWLINVTPWTRRLKENYTKEDSYREETILLFPFLSWVQQPFNGRGNFPWIQLKWLNLPSQGV